MPSITVVENESILGYFMMLLSRLRDLHFKALLVK